MADNIIPGFDETDSQPWSLEATQERILDLLRSYMNYNKLSDKKLQTINKTLAQSFGVTKIISQDISKIAGTSHDMTKIMKDQLKAIRKGNVQDDINDKEAQKILKKGQSGGGGARGILGKISAVGGNLVNTITKFDGSIVGLMATTGVFGALFGVVANTVDSFQQMQQYGQNVGDKLLDLRVIAGEAGMTLGMFTSIMKTHSNIMATVGIKNFAVLQRGVRSLTNQFAHYGLSVEQVNDITAQFIGQRIRQGTLEAKNIGGQTRAVANYMARLHELSRITGRNAAELAKEMDARARDVDLLSVTSAMGRVEGQRFADGLQAMSGITQAGGDEFANQVQQAALHMAQFGTAATSDLGALMAKMGGPMRDSFDSLMQLITSSSSMEEKRDATQEFMNAVKSSRDNADEAGQLNMLQMLAQDEQAKRMTAVVGAMQLTAEETAELATRQNAADGSQQTELTQATQRMLTAGERTMVAFAETSKVLFEKISPSFDNMVQFATDKTKGLVTMAEKVLKAFEASDFTGAISDVWDEVTEKLGKLKDVIKAIIDFEYVQKMKDLLDVIVSLPGRAETAILNFGKGMIDRIMDFFYDKVPGFNRPKGPEEASAAQLEKVINQRDMDRRNDRYVLEAPDKIGPGSFDWDIQNNPHYLTPEQLAKAITEADAGPTVVQSMTHSAKGLLRGIGNLFGGDEKSTSVATSPPATLGTFNNIPQLGSTVENVQTEAGKAITETQQSGGAKAASVDTSIMESQLQSIADTNKIIADAIARGDFGFNRN